MIFRPVHIRPCQIDDIAATANLLTGRRGHILDLLLSRPNLAPLSDGGCQHPVWITEAVERTWLIVQLLSLLDQRSRFGGHHLLPASLEHQVARRLAIAFHTLEYLSDHDLHAHSDLLRCVARDLVELFGPVIGDVTIRLDIERRRLPQLQWRALILTSSHLIMRALLNGYRRRSDGRILVSLCTIAPHCVRLNVTDDGCCATARRDANKASVLDDLALLLDASLSWQRGARNGSVAEVTLKRLHSGRN
jgi:hypothetical protein